MSAFWNQVLFVFKYAFLDTHYGMDPISCDTKLLSPISNRIRLSISTQCFNIHISHAGGKGLKSWSVYVPSYYFMLLYSLFPGTRYHCIQYKPGYNPLFTDLLWLLLCVIVVYKYLLPVSFFTVSFHTTIRLERNWTIPGYYFCDWAVVVHSWLTEVVSLN